MGARTMTTKAVTQYRAAPNAGFGTSTRDQHGGTWRKTDSKGPIYKHEASIGKQVVSYRPSAGNMTFGTSDRNSYGKTYNFYTAKLH
jgi:hypothetical protein